MFREIDQGFMRHAIELAKRGVDSNSGGPFGAIVVLDDKIIGEGWNCVTSGNDPTAHAEVVAIRAACQHLQSFQLTGCTIYTSCEPCPMCLGAIYWSRPTRVLYGCTHADAAAIGFDDHFIYEEIAKPIDGRTIPMIKYLQHEAIVAFQKWSEKIDRIEY